MKERKIGQVNSKSSVTIEEVKKQRTIDKFLSSKPSKRCGYETAMQSNSKGGIESGIESNISERIRITESYLCMLLIFVLFKRGLVVK